MTLLGHKHSIISAKFSENQKYIISGARDDKIKIWNFAKGKLIKTLSGHDGSVKSLALTKNRSQYLVSGSYDKSIKLWNIEQGKLVHTLFEHKDWLNTV